MLQCMYVCNQEGTSDHGLNVPHVIGASLNSVQGTTNYPGNQSLDQLEVLKRRCYLHSQVPVGTKMQISKKVIVCSVYKQPKYIISSNCSTRMKTQIICTKVLMNM